MAGIFINAILGVFNLLPIPLLDGSKILACLLPPPLGASFMRLEPYGFLILLAFAVAGILEWVLSPVSDFVRTSIVNPLL